MNVQIDKTQIAEWIERELEESGALPAIANFKTGFDWNPWTDNGDQYIGAWESIKQNSRLLRDLAVAAAHLAEQIAVDGLALTDPQKRDAVVQVLDDTVRLPWYVEPFDQIAFGMAVDSGVALLRAQSWIRDIAGQGPVDAKATWIEVKPLVLEPQQAKTAIEARARRIKDSSRR